MSKTKHPAVVRVFMGCFYHAPSHETRAVEVLENGILGVTAAGLIAFVEREGTDEKLAALQRQHNFTSDAVTRLGRFDFLMPGLVDTHAHAPQYRNCGLGLDMPLLDWLAKYTYPEEHRYRDVAYAKAVYPDMLQKLLNWGTTTVQFWSTIHLGSSVFLAEEVVRHGMRAFVGKCNVNRNAVDYYTEDTQSSIADTEEFVRRVVGIGSDLVTPCITPRFVPHCTPELMTRLGELAAEHNLPIQSHVSENLDEVAFVRELHPECDSYTAVYERYGLLTSRTTLAHGVHLGDAELELMASKGASLAHCANSNFTLTSGCCDVAKVLRHGIKVGLGTDFSGGYAFNMLDAIRQSTSCSKMVVHFSGGKGGEVMSAELAFYLATLGGARVMCLDDRIGSFAVGKEFDALHVRHNSKHSQYEAIATLQPLEALQRFLFQGDDRNILHTFVKGRRVGGCHE